MADDSENDEPRVESSPPEHAESKKKSRKLTQGVIYLSRIPPFMNVKKIRDIFSRYGEVGKIFLQPDEKAINSKRGRLFTEGWVEFEDKKVAKQVALRLNNSRVGGKKKSKWFDELWNIKYLHRFRWAHLNERLAYEREVRKQRMRTEISQVKREAQFHIRNAEKQQVVKEIEERKKRQGKLKISLTDRNKAFEFKQRETEEEMLNKKRTLDNASESSPKKKQKGLARKRSVASRTKFLQNLFSGSGDDNS